MSAEQDLHAQLAQRLFGWVQAWNPSEPRYVAWDDPQGVQHPAPPAYTTDPAATALVWQWVQPNVGYVTFDYEHDANGVQCALGRSDHTVPTVWGSGATWAVALCRAALALGRGLAGEGER